MSYLSIVCSKIGSNAIILDFREYCKVVETLSTAWIMVEINRICKGCTELKSVLDLTNLQVNSGWQLARSKLL